MLYKNHIGLIPYVDADGIKCACYQLLNQAMKAEATISFRGNILETMSTDKIDAERMAIFIAESREHFNTTKPIIFNTYSTLIK